MDVEKFKKNKASVLTREALFFKDGDPNFTGVAIPVNERRYQSIEKLLEELNEKVHLPNGVRNIMTPNGNHHVRWLHEIGDGKQYVCTSTTKIKKIDYASIQKKPRFKIPRPPSSRVYEPFKKKNLFSERRQLKSLTIISKEDINNTTNVMLTNRVKNIDTLIDEVSEKLGGRVKALTTIEGEPILLLSDLFKNGDCFFAEMGDVCQDKPSSVPVSFYKNHSSKLAGSSPNPVTSSSAKLHKQFVKEKSKFQTKKESAKVNPRRKDTSWLLTIKTSNVENATSDNFAYIALYGKYGKTSEYPLGVPEHLKGYYRDSISEVEIKTADIGDLYKIRIGHDDNGVAIGWHVDTILITNLDTMKEYFFICNRWFSREKDDGEIMREIPLYINGKPILPLIEYEVIVYTGAYNDENTNFDIFIVIEGEKGDTGKRYLEVSLNTAFRSKSIDTFSLEAVYLGQIKDVVITAESLSQEEDVAWFAEKIVVRDTASDIEYNFPLTSDEKTKTPDIFVNNNSNNSPPLTPCDEKSISADMSNSSSISSTLASSDLKISPSSVKKDTSVNKSPLPTSSKSNGHPIIEAGDGIYTSDSSNDIQSISDLYSKTSNPSEKSWNSTKSEVMESEKINGKELDDVSDEFTEENNMHEGIQVIAYSKVTGEALCFNSRSKVVHACGQEKPCCVWTVLDGNIEESVLLYSFQGNGYLAINQSGVTLTKGSPGILNEFYVIISESSETKEISLESVVHPGIFLCSDDHGYVFGTEGQNESTKFLLTHKAHYVPDFIIEDSGCPHFVAPPFWQAQFVRTNEISKNQNADVEAEEIITKEREKKNEEKEDQVDDRFIDGEKTLPSKKKTKKKYKFKKRKKPAKSNEESEVLFKNWLISFTYEVEDTDADNCNNHSDGLSGNESDVIEMRLNPEDSSPSLSDCNENINDKDSELKREISFDQSLLANSEEELFIVLRSESACKTLNDNFEVHQSITDPNLSDISGKDKIVSNGAVNPLDELSNQNSHSFDEENSFDEASIYKNSITADDYDSNEFEGDDESDEYYEWEDERNNMPQPHHFDRPNVLPSRPQSMKFHGTLDRPIIERPHSSPNKYTPLPPIKSYGFSPRTCSVIEAEHRPSSSGRSFSVPCEKNTYKEIPKLNKPASLMTSFVSLADVDSNADDCEVDASALALSSRASERCAIDNIKTPKNSNLLNKPHRKVQQPNASVKSWNYNTDNNIEIIESSKKLHENDIDSILTNQPLSSSMLVEEPSQTDLCITMNIAPSPSIKSEMDYPWGLFD